MKHFMSPLILLSTFLLSASFGACGDSSGDVCDSGTELCECISGQCLGNLVCDVANNICIADNSGSTSDSGDTGAGAFGEDDICARLNECNYLEAGVSAADCSDTLQVCTGDLIGSQYADWNTQVIACLQLANCKNFQECVAVLPDCSPLDGGSCEPNGMPCDFCWAGAECPPEYIGTIDGCDCDCANGVVDPDCG